MKANLERGFWRVALGISCVWWAIGLGMLLWAIYTHPPWMKLYLGQFWEPWTEELPYISGWMAFGFLPIGVFYLVRWIARGFRSE